MATLQQTNTALAFTNSLRSVVQSLKSQSTSVRKVTTFYNALSDVPRTQLCALQNLDRAEVESVIATLETLATSLESLPSTNSTF